MTTVLTKSVPYTVFSLNFNAAGKRPFMAAKAKNMCQRHNFQGGRRWGSEVKDMAPPPLGNLVAKFSEMSFCHLKTYFTQIGPCHLYTVLNRLLPIILPCLQCSLSKMHGQKKKSWYALVLFHIFIYFLVRIGSDQNLPIF